MFPSMFVFVHIRLDQIANLHWVDLTTLAMAHLMMRNTKELDDSSPTISPFGFKLLATDSVSILNPPSGRLCVEFLCIHP